MKQRSFGDFDLGEGNRQAYEWCLDIAEARPVHSQSAVLLGEEGSGKTHLLYAIVNRVRSGSGATGIAYVTAADFPQDALDLLGDPSPLERAASAILLIDHLEDFRDHQDDLEGLARLFLENGHQIVIATSVHPARLRNLPAALEQLLKNGVTIPIESLEDRRVSSSNGRSSNGSSAERSHSEAKNLDELKAILERDYPSKAPEAAPLEVIVSEPMQTNGVGREDPLQELQRQYGGVCAQLERTLGLEEELGVLRDELDMARTESSRPTGGADALLTRAENLLGDIQKSRTHIAAVQSEQRAQISEIRELEATIGYESSPDTPLFAAPLSDCPEPTASQVIGVTDRAGSPEGMDDLKGALDALTHERKETRLRMAALREEIGRTQLWDAEREDRARASELEVKQQRDTLTNALAERDTFRLQCEKSEEERRVLEYSVKDAWREHGKLQESLAAMRAELDAAKSNARERAAELESLRHSAAEQVGATHARLNEQESALASLRAERASRHRAHEETVHDFGALREQLNRAAEAMTRLSSRLDSDGLSEEDEVDATPTNENVESAALSLEEEQPFYFGPQDPNTDAPLIEDPVERDGGETSTRRDLALAGEALPDDLGALRVLIDKSAEQLAPSAQSEEPAAFQSADHRAPHQPAEGISKSPVPFDFEELSPGAGAALHHVEELRGETDSSVEETSPFSVQGLDSLNRLIYADDEDPSI
jgi:hypothetical protein